LADSNITVSGLTATGGINQINLAWDTPVDPNVNGLPYLRFVATEIWKSDSNDRSAPEFVGETSGNSFSHLNVPRGSRFYYWIRARDRSGLYSNWFPVSSTSGIVGEESNVVPALLQTNGFIRHVDGWVEEWGQNTSQSATIEGEALNGVIPITFQTTFTKMFGVSAIAQRTTSNLFVTTLSLTTTGMVLQAVRGVALQGEGTNNVLVYWRVFGV